MERLLFIHLVKVLHKVLYLRRTEMDSKKKKKKNDGCFSFPRGEYSKAPNFARFTAGRAGEGVPTDQPKIVL